MAAAILARVATGGSAVAIILLARTYGAEGKVAGALAACLTAPHLLGPIYGRWLDEMQKPNRLIALGCFMFAGFFQLAIASFEWRLDWLLVCALLVCGAGSSFMMGGLSTQVVTLVDDHQAARRKAQSLDTITYGLGLTLGPMLIAFLTAIYSTQLSISLVMSLPVLAGGIILSLPNPSHQATHHEKPPLRFKQLANIIIDSAPLTRTFTMTCAASFAVAALPVLSVYLSESWQQTKESGAYLVTAYGLGCLCGALLLILKPIRAEALILLRNVGAALLVTLVLVNVSQSFNMGLAAYWFCGVVNAIFFAVTLAARTEYSPQNAAAQVYMWVASAKIGAASLGALVAGFFVDQFLTLPLIISATVLLTALILCFRKG